VAAAPAGGGPRAHGRFLTVVERDLRARWARPRSGPKVDSGKARPEVSLHPDYGTS